MNRIGWMSLRSALAVTALAAASAAQAQQPLPPPYPPPPGAYARPVDGPILVPPREVVRMLRWNGYSVLTPPRLRGVVYSVGVVGPDGLDGRVLVDARDGILMRFVQAYAMAGRGDFAEVDRYARVPPVAAPPMSSRPEPRKPVAVAPATAAGPKVASRAPATTVQPHTEPAPKSVASTPAPTRTASSAETTASAAKPGEPRPATVEAKPSWTILPTQDMPPVQPLD